MRTQVAIVRATGRLPAERTNNTLGSDERPARRAVLEGLRDSDDVVLAHALDVVAGSGGYLTLVGVVLESVSSGIKMSLSGPVPEQEPAPAEDTLAVRLLCRHTSCVLC